MNKSTSILSIAAASALALQAPVVQAADNTNTTQSSTSTQNGVPGVDVDVGRNASDRGLPGVEMNVGKDGDQKNIDTNTQSMGAGPDTSTSDSATMGNSDSQSQRPARADRN